MHIVTEYGATNPLTGYVERIRACTLQEVIDQMMTVLASVVGEDGTRADQAAEWVSSMFEDTSKPFPQGEPIVAVRRGHCEGCLIQVLVDHQKIDKVYKAISIKYLSDLDMVYRAGRALSEAFDNGLFTTVAPEGFNPDTDFPSLQYAT